MKIRPVEAELFRTDRHDEANIRFSVFCAGAKNEVSLKPLPNISLRE
jgi:hypothetical protein